MPIPGNPSRVTGNPEVEPDEPWENQAVKSASRKSVVAWQSTRWIGRE